AVPFPRAALVENGPVRWVAVGGSGTDHLRPWDPARLTVTNSAGVAADMMAEYVLGTLLSFSLDLRGFAAKQQARQWDSAGRVTPIAGGTVLILGLGKTGTAVAKRCKAMGMKVLGVRANPGPMEDVDEVHGMAALPSLWSKADAIVCCVPLLDSTRGLVGAPAFAAMKPDVILIDISRGGVVDEPALVAALDAGRLKGVARDVFATEPLPADHRLWAYDNVIVTPHCSSVYRGWDVNSARMFAANLARYRNSEPLANVVDPVRGY
ncbi:MAG TPA: D-2-hydroxyacid dehydrogenase, partial [Nordella sp.]|nr:D-2-hydroxyacid dehydrogenase [Nordella sp.]